MLVAIDGWPSTYKAAVARWITKALGGLFIDCRSLPLYLAKNYDSKLDLEDLWGLETWVATLKVEVGFEFRNGIFEGSFGVNGNWYRQEDVSGFKDYSQKLLSLAPVREIYSSIIDHFNFEDRVILLGDDILVEFYNGPYRFFIDSFKRKTPSERNWFMFDYSGKRKFYEEGATFYSHAANAIMINGECARLGDAVMMILVECVGRAHDSGTLPVSLGEGFFVAADMGDTLRNQINRGGGHPFV
jgi:cytidylate kinase